MRIEHVDLAETECFSSIFIDYIQQKDSLKPFYKSFPDVETFGELIKERQLSPQNRLILENVIFEQYGALQPREAVTQNIHDLSDSKTFTVTTGHQLNIFTGPLYFIYKIATAINACNQLKAAYPDYNFVPVYWMASEDHDLEEISHFNLFGKSYKWETNQTGPVGRMIPHSLNQIIDQLPEDVPLFEKAYLDNSNLTDAVRYYVHELFGNHGLVVIDAADSRLKSIFSPIIEKDLFENKANELVNETSNRLNEAGYKTQAFSREINFFYMEKGLRSRIVREDGVFKVLDTDKTFTDEEIKKLLKEKPELFSPNVIMRPLYQETILPNIAYIGGPAEIAYWLQLKDVFEHHKKPFPALMPRVFGMIINKAIGKKIKKLKFSGTELFKPNHVLKEEYLKKHSDSEFDLHAEQGEIGEVFEKIKQQAEEIDASLTGFIGAEGAKALKSLENISKRLKKAEEQNNETAMQQIDTVKEKLFPGGGLQERHDNFLNFYLNSPTFIEILLHKFDAFAYQFHVLYDE